MSDYRSFWIEMALKALPQAFYVAKSDCGGEAVVLAPNEATAREAATRIWAFGDGDYQDPASFTVDRVPVVLCPVNASPDRSFDGIGFWDVTGCSDFFGDVDQVRAAIMTARGEAPIEQRREYIEGRIEHLKRRLAELDDQS